MDALLAVSPYFYFPTNHVSINNNVQSTVCYTGGYTQLYNSWGFIFSWHFHLAIFKRIWWYLHIVRPVTVGESALCSALARHIASLVPSLSCQVWLNVVVNVPDKSWQLCQVSTWLRSSYQLDLINSPHLISLASHTHLEIFPI